MEYIAEREDDEKSEISRPDDGYVYHGKRWNGSEEKTFNHILIPIELNFKLNLTTISKTPESEKTVNGCIAEKELIYNAVKDCPKNNFLHHSSGNTQRKEKVAAYDISANESSNIDQTFVKSRSRRKDYKLSEATDCQVAEEKHQSGCSQPLISALGKVLHSPFIKFPALIESEINPNHKTLIPVPNADHACVFHSRESSESIDPLLLCTFSSILSQKSYESTYAHFTEFAGIAKIETSQPAATMRDDLVISHAHPSLKGIEAEFNTNLKSTPLTEDCLRQTADTNCTSENISQSSLFDLGDELAFSIDPKLSAEDQQMFGTDPSDSTKDVYRRDQHVLSKHVAACSRCEITINSKFNYHSYSQTSASMDQTETLKDFMMVNTDSVHAALPEEKEIFTNSSCMQSPNNYEAIYSEKDEMQVYGNGAKLNILKFYIKGPTSLQKAFTEEIASKDFDRRTVDFPEKVVSKSSESILAVRKCNNPTNAEGKLKQINTITTREISDKSALLTIRMKAKSGKSDMELKESKTQKRDCNNLFECVSNNSNISKSKQYFNTLLVNVVMSWAAPQVVLVEDDDPSNLNEVGPHHEPLQPGEGMFNLRTNVELDPHQNSSAHISSVESNTQESTLQTRFGRVDPEQPQLIEGNFRLRPNVLLVSQNSLIVPNVLVRNHSHQLPLEASNRNYNTHERMPDNAMSSSALQAPIQDVGETLLSRSSMLPETTRGSCIRNTTTIFIESTQALERDEDTCTRCQAQAVSRLVFRCGHAVCERCARLLQASRCPQCTDG